MKNTVFLFGCILMLFPNLPATGGNNADRLVNVQDIEHLCRSQSGHYSYMWWIHPVKEGPLKFAVKTDQYAFIFDENTLDFQNLLMNADTRSAEEVLCLSTDELFPATEGPGLSFGIETNGVFHPCTQASSRGFEDCQLIHTGRFLQQRFINNLPGLSGYELLQSGLDIVAWPDRLSLLLRMSLTGDSPRDGSNAFVVRFAVPTAYQAVSDAGGLKVFRHPVTGNGYIIGTADASASLTVSDNTVEARLHPQNPTDNEYTVGLIVYPVADVNAALPGIAAQENHQATVTAQQSAPVNATLGVTYDAGMGWYDVQLRNDFTGEAAQDDQRMERVFFTVENTSSFDRTVRLNFSKERPVYAQTTGSNTGISGISAMIRDENEYPTGIAVQLSKNWHITDFYGYAHHRYRGNWYHGITMLHIPAGSKVELEYTSVNACWGTVPAASHAQLCLAGWGSNQQWNESAIGAWGESISYEPDLVQASSPVCDSRILMAYDSQGKKTVFSGNVGGADFFNCRKPGGNGRSWHAAVKTYYKRYCPNFTEVINAGEILEGRIRFDYAVSIGRSDDYVRGIYRLRMEVKQDVAFDRLDIFQLASEGYHLSQSRKIAVGNKNGMTLERNARNSSPSAYVGHPEAFSGETPWVSFFDTPYTDDEGTGWGTHWTSADRGFVIRNWKSRINGQVNVAPHWQEYSVGTGYLHPASIVNVTLPETCASLSAGDFVEAEIEWFFLPLFASQYWGPNDNLKKALQRNGGSWRMTLREATGNHITVATERGTVEKHYPIIIAAENNEAHFTVTGGIGYVPLTVTGLSSYFRPALYVKKNGKWEAVDQSNHGNDFWQVDYDPNTEAWECTYNVNLDSEQDQPVTREFMFLLDGDAPVDEPTSVAALDMSPAELRIYPNPVKDRFYIRPSPEWAGRLFTVEIFDSAGKIVLSKRITGTAEAIDVSQLTHGVHIVRMSHPNFSQSCKITIEN
ncbi:MAG: T9SS type A sorting domain-containing protein [Bacteroidales bacterium]|nr:T9SS type A sorting domain-containing protein [Bacteroidales bacterium]